MEFHRKDTRLKHFRYKGDYIYSLTICTHIKTTYFDNDSLVEKLTELLCQVAEKHDFRIIVYCFMPDHLHLLIQGSENSKLITFIKEFKQISGYRFKKDHGSQLWQKGYYDHVVRDDEDVIEAARYILNNPVRKGLVTDFWQYPYLGSFVYDIEEGFELR